MEEPNFAVRVDRNASSVGGAAEPPSLALLLVCAPQAARAACRSARGGDGLHMTSPLASGACLHTMTLEEGVEPKPQTAIKLYKGRDSS